MDKMKLKNATSIRISSFIAMLILSVLMISCGSKNEGNDKGYVKLVKTANVVKISSDKTKQYPGIIEETEDVNLAFRVAGPIQKIYIKEGDFVKKGQLIAEMDPRDYEVQKNAIEAQVLQLQSEYKRIEELKNRKSVADNDYEKMKAGKEMAEAKLKNAIDQLNDTKLYAPFSGYITKVMFENGEMVNHGTPIASIIDVSLLKVEINVPAYVYININKIRKIEFTQENIPGKTFSLTLYANNIKANNNGLYKLYLYHKPEPDSKLAPGMNVSVKLTCSNPKDEVLSIPINAIFQKDGENYVWVVKDSKVNLREIETNSIIQDGNIGITSGLSENEIVVIGGLNLLSEGRKVRLVASVSETNVGNIL